MPLSRSRPFFIRPKWNVGPAQRTEARTRNQRDGHGPAITGLLKDLKSRIAEGDAGGPGWRVRPHTGYRERRWTRSSSGRFTIWMAGGGAKPGLLYGATDELGNKSVENIVTVHDLHATILELLGLDHKRLIYRYGGRDVTLPDVHGRAVKELIA